MPPVHYGLRSNNSISIPNFMSQMGQLKVFSWGTARPQWLLSILIVTWRRHDIAYNLMPATFLILSWSDGNWDEDRYLKIQTI